MRKEPTHRALVGDALDTLFRVLMPYVEERMREAYGDEWVKEARGNLHGKPPSRWDVSDLFTLIYFRYAHAFRAMGHEGRSWVSILKEVRKKWAHQGELSVDETRRALEISLLVLRAVGAEEEASRLEPRVLSLMQRELAARSGETAPPPVDADESLDEAVDGAGRVDKKKRWMGRIGLLGRRAPEEPIELRRDLLDAVEHAVRPLRHHAAFNRILVHVVAADGRTRLLYESAFEGQEEPFPRAVSRRLAEARLPVPAGLHVGWTFHAEVPRELEGCFEGRAYYVELHRRSALRTATLSVEAGRAERERYEIRNDAAVTVGRLADVLDDRGRLVRRNRVAFLDYDDPRLDASQREILQTVSRSHAHLAYDEAEAVFRLYDDQSTWGTSVVREGYPVPIQVKQQPVALHDGDLLYFGKACLRFTVDS